MCTWSLKIELFKLCIKMTSAYNNTKYNETNTNKKNNVDGTEEYWGIIKQ